MGTVEPEQACYCYPESLVYSITDTGRQLGTLELPLDLTDQTLDNGTVVQSYLPFGMSLQFWTYLRFPNTTQERILVGIQDYGYLILSFNQTGAYLNLDLLARIGGYSRSTFNVSPKFNSWQLYELVITSRSVRLFVNQVETQTIIIDTPKVNAPKLLFRIGPIFSLQVYQHNSLNYNSTVSP